MIDGVEVTVDREAVVVTASAPLAVVSSAGVGRGFTSAPALRNLPGPKSPRLGGAESPAPAVRPPPPRPVPSADGRLASGTSTDAVVVAATGRGPRCRFGGPVSDLGAVVARAVREALSAGIDRWLEEHQ